MTNGEQADRLDQELATLRSDAIRDHALIDALRDQLREYRRETQHQVRNLLSIVRSVARRTSAKGETAEEYQFRLDSRLASITRVQGYILRQPNAGIDLSELIVGELAAFNVDERTDARVDGRPISVKPVSAAVLGLAFQELARLTIEGEDGRTARGMTTVRWWVDPAAGIPESLTIEWQDIGRGLNAAALARSAFAYDVLENAIPYQLKGDAKLDEIDGGISCIVRVPINCVASW